MEEFQDSYHQSKSGFENPFNFKEEIERRFRKSVVNKIYIFPRNSELEDSVSTFSSTDSLANQAAYDLSSQNTKKVSRMAFTDRLANMMKKTTRGASVPKKKDESMGSYSTLLDILKSNIRKANKSSLSKKASSNSVNRNLRSKVKKYEKDYNTVYHDETLQLSQAGDPLNSERGGFHSTILHYIRRYPFLSLNSLVKTRRTSPSPTNSRRSTLAT